MQHQHKNAVGLLFSKCGWDYSVTSNKQKYTRIWAKQPQQGKMEGQFSHILLGIIGQISHRIVGSLCVEAEIVVYSSCHLKPSVVTEVQHVPLLLFAPMFPPMNLVLGHGYVAVLVHLLDDVGKASQLDHGGEGLEALGLAVGSNGEPLK